jgi:hypothetical protein
MTETTPALTDADRDIIAALCSGIPEAEHEAIALHFLAAGAARARPAPAADNMSDALPRGQEVCAENVASGSPSDGLVAAANEAARRATVGRPDSLTPAADRLEALTAERDEPMGLDKFGKVIIEIGNAVRKQLPYHPRESKPLEQPRSNS